MSAGPTKSQRQLESRCVQRGFEYDRMLGLRRAQLFAAHLDVATFATSAECIAAVRAAGRELCAVNLGPPCAGPLRGQITVKSPGFLDARCAMPKRGAPADTTNHWLCDGDQC